MEGNDVLGNQCNRHRGFGQRLETTNQIVGFVTVPSEKENRYCYFLYCNIPLFLVQMGFQRKVVMWIIRGAIQKKRFAVAII